MKKTALLLLSIIFTFASCSTETGPQGPPGEDGADGLIASIIEIEGDFNEDNDYTLVVDYEDYNLEVFESDVVMVYLKVAETTDSNGAAVDVFTPIPQTYFVGSNEVIYNFIFTYFSTAIYLDTNMNFSNIPAEFTDNQVLRIAVIPAAYANNPANNIYDYNSVITDFNLHDTDVISLD
jgi:hypothetical protein